MVRELSSTPNSSQDLDSTDDSFSQACILYHELKSLEEESSSVPKIVYPFARENARRVTDKIRQANLQDIPIFRKAISKLDNLYEF